VIRPLFVFSAAFVTAAACGGSAEQTAVTKPAVKPDNQGYRPGGFDRCPVLRSCYAESVADDCPEPVVSFASASSELNGQSQRLLSEVVIELNQVDAIAKLQVTAYALKTEPPYVASARADAVKKWLVGHGVKAELLELGTVTAATTGGHVAFEAQACSGQRDDDGQDGTAAAPFLLF